MIKRIFYSICFVAFTVFTASFLLIMGVLYRYFSEVQQNQLEMQTILAAQGVSHEGIDYFAHLEMGNLRITWINEKGEVLYDSESDTSQMENHLEREEIKEAFSEGYGESRRYSQTLMERLLYCAKALEDGTVVRLSTVQYTVLTLMFNMAAPVGMVFLAAVALSVILAVRLSKSIGKPLNELNLDEPLSNQEYDELSPLLRRMDRQQTQLRSQEEQLKQKEKELDVVVGNMKEGMTLLNDKAEQMRREFTANVSHELKTPLHTICGYAELLQAGMVDSKDIIPFAGKIYTEARRMVQLVEDVISLSHLDEGAEGMKREAVDLYALAKAVTFSLESEAELAAVSMELTGETAVIKGVLQLLHSIIYNICDNAIKYNHGGGSVSIRVKNDSAWAEVCVKDTGIGIDPEHQERIFERFYRVDKSHSKEVGGTGLGLSIVKHAAKIHDAKIELHSVKEEGTTITVRFPKN